MFWKKVMPLMNKQSSFTVWGHLSFKIKSIRVLGLSGKNDFARLRAEAAGNSLARWLTSLPPV